MTPRDLLSTLPYPSRVALIIVQGECSNCTFGSQPRSGGDDPFEKGLEVPLMSRACVSPNLRGALKVDSHSRTSSRGSPLPLISRRISRLEEDSTLVLKAPLTSPKKGESLFVSYLSPYLPQRDVGTRGGSGSDPRSMAGRRKDQGKGQSDAPSFTRPPP